LPGDLPHEVITHLPAHTCCPDCGGALRQFGEDVSEQLERIPATYKVIQHVRPKFACAACEQVVEAPAPARPIDHGLPGPSLLAHVLVLVPIQSWESRPSRAKPQNPETLPLIGPDRVFDPGSHHQPQPHNDRRRIPDR
jgi:transposase